MTNIELKALEIAKEITVATMQQHEALPKTLDSSCGERVGEYFEAIFKKVKEIVNS